VASAVGAAAVLVGSAASRAAGEAARLDDPLRRLILSTTEEEASVEGRLQEARAAFEAQKAREAAAARAEVARAAAAARAAARARDAAQEAERTARVEAEAALEREREAFEAREKALRAEMEEREAQSRDAVRERARAARRARAAEAEAHRAEGERRRAEAERAARARREAEAAAAERTRADARARAIERRLTAVCDTRVTPAPPGSRVDPVVASSPVAMCALSLEVATAAGGRAQRSGVLFADVDDLAEAALGLAAEAAQEATDAWSAAHPSALAGVERPEAEAWRRAARARIESVLAAGAFRGAAALAPAMRPGAAAGGRAEFVAALSSGPVEVTTALYHVLGSSVDKDEDAAAADAAATASAAPAPPPVGSVADRMARAQAELEAGDGDGDGDSGVLRRWLLPLVADERDRLDAPLPSLLPSSSSSSSSSSVPLPLPPSFPPLGRPSDLAGALVAAHFLDRAWVGRRAGDPGASPLFERTVRAARALVDADADALLAARGGDAVAAAAEAASRLLGPRHPAAARLEERAREVLTEVELSRRGRRRARLDARAAERAMEAWPDWRERTAGGDDDGDGGGGPTGTVPAPEAAWALRNAALSCRATDPGRAASLVRHALDRLERHLGGGGAHPGLSTDLLVLAAVVGPDTPDAADARRRICACALAHVSRCLGDRGGEEGEREGATTMSRADAALLLLEAAAWASGGEEKGDVGAGAAGEEGSRDDASAPDGGQDNNDAPTRCARRGAELLNGLADPVERAEIEKRLRSSVGAEARSAAGRRGRAGAPPASLERMARETEIVIEARADLETRARRGSDRARGGGLSSAGVNRLLVGLAPLPSVDLPPPPPPPPPHDARGDSTL